MLSFSEHHPTTRTVTGFPERSHSSAPISRSRDVQLANATRRFLRFFFFSKTLERFRRSHSRKLEIRGGPLFREGVAPPPSCGSSRRDGTRKRARCVWNSGRPDLAQRDSAWLSSRPPPPASVLVGGYTSISLPLPSVPFSLPLSPSLRLSLSHAVVVFLSF